MQFYVRSFSVLKIQSCLIKIKQIIKVNLNSINLL